MQFVRRIRKDLPQDTMSDRELAFVNQEDGSTIQRGLALSSTSKHLHGNEGYRFGKSDGVALVIDLARIPQREQDVDELLLTFIATMHRRETPPEASKEHTDCSTKKNPSYCC